MGALPTTVGSNPATTAPTATAPASAAANAGNAAVGAATTTTTAPVRKGRATRKQLADEATAKAAAAKAAAVPTATPGTPAPATGIAAPPATTPVATPPAATAGAGTAASAPVTAYTTQLNSPHVVVLVFSKDAPATADLTAQLTAYNNRFFKANNLTVEAQTLGADQLVVVKTLPWAKVAQSYATKLRGPQSPLAKLRGAGYQTLVISPENLALLQSSGDLAGYLTFYQRMYK